jgi:hypothetical protein
VSTARGFDVDGEAMNCEQRRDLMPLLLVDALDPADAAALRAHVASGCTRCASYLAEADAILNHLPFALDPVSPPAGAKTRLMERVKQSTPAAALAPKRGGRLWLPGWARKSMPAAIAACLAFVATVQGMLHIQRGRDEAARKQNNELQQVILEKSKHNSMLSTEVAIAKNLYSSSKQITLVGATQPKAFGRAMWDAPRGAWHFKAFNLEPLSKDVAYQLWFETPYGRKVPTAKTFTPDEHGDAYVVVTLPQDVGPVSRAFVTDEPSVGTYQPTGTVHLAGKME